MHFYPEERFSYSLAYDESNQEIILFGGFAPGMKFKDTWSWNGQEWCLLTNYGPSARDSAAITYDSRRECIFLFGGHTIDDRFENDTWRWKDHKWVQLVVAGPPARNHSSMVYFPPMDKTILFGGRSKTVDLGDTWAWDGTQWHNLDIPGPSPRDGYRMVYDSARKKIILFGGRSRDEGGLFQLGDTWEFDGSAWALVSHSGPKARSHHGMFFDQVSGKITLFGGENNADPSLEDCWCWDGSKWQTLNISVPSPRSRFFVVPAQAGYFLFGGKSPNGALKDTWHLGISQNWKRMAFPEDTFALALEDHP